MKTMLLLFLLIGGMVTNLNAAMKEEDRNPLGCNDIGYEYYMETLHLSSSQGRAHQTLYFIYNKLNQPITLYQMRGNDSSQSMYLNHTIGSNQWGVLSTFEQQVKYICSIAQGKSPYGQIVDCAKSLRVCEYNNVKFGLNNRGNYWLVNSNTKNGAIREVVRYGIIPAI